MSGIKRHLGVDTGGLPHAIPVTPANTSDKAGALTLFKTCKAPLTRVQKGLVEGGYTGEPLATAVLNELNAAVEVAKRNQLHTFAVLPKR